MSHPASWQSQSRVSTGLWLLTEMVTPLDSLSSVLRAFPSASFLTYVDRPPPTVESSMAATVKLVESPVAPWGNPSPRCGPVITTVPETVQVSPMETPRGVAGTHRPSAVGSLMGESVNVGDVVAVGATVAVGVGDVPSLAGSHGIGWPED